MSEPSSKEPPSNNANCCGARGWYGLGINRERR